MKKIKLPDRIRITDLSKIATTSPNTGKARPDISKATIKKYITTINRLKEFFGPERDITTIEPGELWEWSESLGEKYPNAITANSYRRDARAIWNYMLKIGANICSTDDAFVMEKVSRTLKAISDTNYWRVMTSAQPPAMAAILAESGMRRDALRGMLVSKTTFWVNKQGENCMATEVQEKGGDYEIKFGLHLSASLLASWLDIRKQFLAAMGVKDHDFVWVATDTGGPMSYDNIGNIFEGLKERARVPKHDPASPHAYRRHFAQKRALEGAPITLIQKWLGHASPETTEIYLGLDDEALKRAFFSKVYQQNLTDS